MTTISEWWMWVGFLVFIAIMLVVDLFLLGGKKAHRVSTREAIAWTIVWVSFALIFNLLLWWYLLHTTTEVIANQKALEFFTGYLIEKSLSVDNIFVFIMIFSYFSVPLMYQRRVLLYGVLGAIVMRLIIILLGIWIVNQFHWVLYLFGVFLLFTGLKMCFFANDQVDLQKNPILKWLNQHLRLTETIQDEKFIVRHKGLIYLTPLFLVLVFVEISDLIFATDSIPAIFAITNDPFIVFTSNIFAILGLRALYFLLANMHSRFHLLKYGIALILIFIGCKMLLAYWFTIPIYITLSVIVITLLFFMVLSSLPKRLLRK